MSFLPLLQDDNNDTTDCTKSLGVTPSLKVVKLGLTPTKQG